MATMNPGEQDERQYLGEILGRLRSTLDKIEAEILAYSESVEETKRFAWENIAALDNVEKAAYRIAVNEESEFAEMAITERNRIRKLLRSPYFGRVDFQAAGEGDAAPYYIGIHSYSDSDDGGKTRYGKELIIDWRAPLSSIFYDYETGYAMYRAPEGEIEGDVRLKRQYRIREGQMEYMLESALNIGDDILQQELSRTTDEKMRNIVATIQKEQNQIIRNESAKVLIIQGAAGSGKTSIALHRVAFLLYRYKHALRSDDVLVLSPNKVFGSYISNVLPELGEENIPQMGFEDLANQFLGRKRGFQTFAEQVAQLIEGEDEALIRRIRYKARPAFVEELGAFLQRCDEDGFEPEGFRVGPFSITAEILAEEYRRLGRMPVRKRLEKIASDRTAAYLREQDEPLSAAQKRQIKERIAKMFRYPDALAIYRAFFADPALKGEKLFATLPKGVLEFCDVFPLCWLTLRFEGTAHRYREIKHLLVDEMQDYTPIQYAFLAEVFQCRMTILGDSYQCVNPYTSSSLETIRPFFAGCECVELQKSYRSTIEIVSFVQTIRRNQKILPIERHGEEPVLMGRKNREEETACIRERIRAFRDSGYRSLGIICKSQGEAQRLFDGLEDPDIALLDFSSEEFTDGVILTSAHISKGLEFDWVIVPGCSEEGYRTELDRSLLYIACTRAMHRLELTFYGKQSGMISPGVILFR